MTGFADADLTRDGFLDGRLRLLQPRTGYRAAIDPVLLAAFAPAEPGMRVLDLGCGAGTAALCLGARVAGLELHGLEVQPAYAELARRNAAENAQALCVHDGDLRRPSRTLRALAFDLVLMNPPFLRAGAGVGAEDPGRDRAHREGDAALGDWIAMGLRRLRPGGGIVMIHLATRLAEALAALAGPAGGVELLPVAPRADAPASRVLLRGRKGARAPLTLHPPLTLHALDESGAAAMRYTEAAEAVLRTGSALLPTYR